MLDTKYRAKLKAMLMAEEGFRSSMYYDTKNVPTIGFGRNLRDTGITLDEASLLLDNDMRRVEMECIYAFDFFPCLDDVRKVVVMDMCFNLGLQKLKGFKKMLAALDAKDYVTAAKHMRDSLWYEQVKSRAEKLARIMENGVL